MINQEQLIKKRPSGSPSMAALNLLRKASPHDIVYPDSIALSGRIWNNPEGQSEFFPYLLIKPHFIYIAA